MSFVVRAPNWLGDVVMSFPFLHALAAEYPDADIAVIIKGPYAPLLDLLPFPVRAVSFAKTDHPGLAGIVRFSRRTSGLSDREAYFCLPPSFSAAFMGRCLRARQVVGFSGQWRDLLLTRRGPAPDGLHRSREHLRLLSLFTRRDHTSFPPVRARPLEPFLPDGSTEPYLVLNPTSAASSRRLPADQWVRLVEGFADQRFVVIGSPADRQANADLLARFPPRNRYHDLTGRTDILELTRLLAGSLGVITNDSGPAHLAAYAGADVAVFFGAGDAANTAPAHSSGAVLVLREDLDCSPCLKNSCPLRTLVCLAGMDMAGAVARIRAFLAI